MKTFSSIRQELIKLDEDGPCWDSHKQVGMKKKNGRMVPNCVPKEDKEDRTTSPQDPDIKGRKGSQPKGYHKGLKKSTKIARDRQFKKQAKLPSHMAKDAPGDKEARKKPMPLSKHTIKYRRMFGDEFDESLISFTDVYIFEACSSI